MHGSNNKRPRYEKMKRVYLTFHLRQVFGNNLIIYIYFFHCYPAKANHTIDDTYLPKIDYTE